ncbi:MAG TPA: hypothetical protein VFJ97_12185 [Dermatophilaceae bacterium]|nr:hypothetical protein [Dermatophilaceae bacterium]
MAVRVGDCTLVQRLERGGRAGSELTGVFLARADRTHEWVIVDVRRADVLQPPDDDLDAELAARPGLLVPVRRVRDRARGLVGLVEPLRPRQSLFAHGAMDPQVAAALFAGLLQDTAPVLQERVGFGPLTTHDVVLVEAGGAGGVRLALVTGGVQRLPARATARRNLTAVLRLLPQTGGASGPLAELVRSLLRGVEDGSLDAVGAADRLWLFARPVPPPPDLPPLPPLPDQEAEADRAAALPAPPRGLRRVGPLEIGMAVLGLAAAAALVVLLQEPAAPAPADGATPASAATSSTSAPAVKVQPDPAAVPAVGRPCAFYDVGVLDRSGTAVLQCTLQDDGTYRWRNRS